MTPPPEQTPQQRIQQVLAAAWLRAQPEVQLRLQALRQAAEAGCLGTLQPAAHAEANAIAHKLAGTLGMYGFPQGTDPARELEDAWSAAEPDAERCLQLSRQLRQALFPAAAGEETCQPEPGQAL